MCARISLHGQCLADAQLYRAVAFRAGSLRLKDVCCRLKKWSQLVIMEDRMMNESETRDIWAKHRRLADVSRWARTRKIETDGS